MTGTDWAEGDVAPNLSDSRTGNFQVVAVSFAARVRKKAFLARDIANAILQNWSRPAAQQH